MRQGSFGSVRVKFIFYKAKVIHIKINLVYFSPTGTTKKVVMLISKIFSTEKTEYDITLNSDENIPSFNKDDFVILGIPVYSGRVPRIANKIISAIKGENTPIALISTYGNRDYNDSLLELKMIVELNGFLTVAAAAFVTEHSVVPKFGAGRPNDEDVKEINRFAGLLSDKIKLWNLSKHNDLKLKGNLNYREYKSIPIKPHSTSLCVKCGLCAKNCPASAIPFDNPRKTDRSKCVTCVRCIYFCPKNARCFYGIEKFFAEKSLEKLCKKYKKPEIFM